MLLTLPLPSAQWVAKQLLQCDAAPDLYEDDLAKSCLQETGNIVGSAYIGSIASWLDVMAKPTAPRLAIDLPSALLQPLLIEQADPNQGHIEITGGLQIIARQYSQSTGVNRQ